MKRQTPSTRKNYKYNPIHESDFLENLQQDYLFKDVSPVSKSLPQDYNPKENVDVPITMICVKEKDDQFIVLHRKLY